jgi:hypothetical protein
MPPGIFRKFPDVDELRKTAMSNKNMALINKRVGIVVGGVC